jgi:hypothetical protein
VRESDENRAELLKFALVKVDLIGVSVFCFGSKSHSACNVFSPILHFF